LVCSIVFAPDTAALSHGRFIVRQNSNSSFGFGNIKTAAIIPKNLIITVLFLNQPFDSGSSAINRLARSARALASFASYADQLLSHAEVVSRVPERHSDLGKTET
jgi:hypothetical protein